jgi:hypothetical protein
MINNEQFIEYLKSKIVGFEKTSKKGQILFTCPNVNQHKYKGNTPTMTPISGSDKFYCLQCGFKGTIYDCIRILEVDKKSFSDGQIMEYLANTMKIDNYPELNEYKKYGWSLLPIAKNGKIPLEKGWTETEHKEKSDWLKWIESGLNIGVRTGEVSGITVIDADLKVAPSGEYEEIYKELTASKTLIQNTPHGKHFIFKYDKEIKQTSKIAGVTIDIRNDGGQILCSPSKINNLNYTWVNLGSDIKNVPEIVKVKLLSLNKVDRVETEKMSEDLTQSKGELPKLKNNNLIGCCNDTFIKLGGILINKLTPEQVEFTLSVFNTQLLENPMPQNAIRGMIGSLEGYKETEESTQEKAIYECCKLLQCDISAKDVMEHTNLKRAIVDKYLAKLHKEGKLVRRGRGRYDLKQQIEWVTEAQEFSAEYKYKIPYFNDVAHFHSGDIILLGTPTGKGKTHIALNIIKQMKEQGVMPYYISLESGSRHEKIAQQLGLTSKDYYISKESIDNPTQIEIVPNSCSIIDWLYTGEDFAMTQSVFKHLADEMRRKGGILVVFTQLKESYDYFAVNLIKSFASFAARYIYDDSTGVIGHWEIDKMRDPKGHYQTARVDCSFDFSSKLLIKKEII